MRIAMTPKTIAIVSPGDMGHAVGRALRASGHEVVTSLAGRSAHSRRLAEQGGLRDLGSLEAVVGAADIVLAILPPEAAPKLAVAVAEAMRRTGKRPVYVDCNAIAPETMRGIARTVEAAGAPVIDVGIVGSAPGKAQPTRFYASGPDTGPVEALAREDLLVKPLGPELGRASAMKMVYAANTKGTFTLHAAVLLAAEMLGLEKELSEELQFSQKDTYAQMQRMVPRIPVDAQRWIGEMQEIQKTFKAAGVTPGFHEGAAWVFSLLAKTPFAAETRATFDTSRTLEQALAVYAETLRAAADR
jgi:3-hydroxyisobutyrate dehydrogenase-like beta-hydroxyacid dehydrogenase